MSTFLFADRQDAGRRLAKHLSHLQEQEPVVMALPRGGVPLGAEIAQILEAPLDVIVIRKLGCPWQPELAIGAVGEGGERLLNTELISKLRLDSGEVEQVYLREAAVVDRRIAAYRDSRPAVPVKGRTAILVDDGIATGFTARTAIQILRERGAKRVVLAIPLAPSNAVEQFRRIADEVVVLETPESFRSVGQWYRDFSQVSDLQVQSLLAGSILPADSAADAPRRD